MRLEPKLCIGEFPVNTRHHFQNVRGGKNAKQAGSPFFRTLRGKLLTRVELKPQ